MKSHKLADGAYALCYHDLPGHGKPLLFIHGLGCASSCDYPAVAAAPALAGRHSVLIDLLGTAFSDRPIEFPYTVEAHAQTIAQLVIDKGWQSVDLFGHSMGGAVAISTASLLKERIAHLVLAEPNLDSGGGFFSRKVAAWREDEYVARGHADTVAEAIAQGNQIWASSLNVSAPYAVHRAACSLMHGGEASSWRGSLYAFAMPRTVIFGEKSLPDVDYDKLPGAGVAVSVVANAGHSLALDNPPGLAAAIAQALESN
jgi:pimeloyl-ACP methyl ester carboxylesterase